MRITCSVDSDWAEHHGYIAACSGLPSLRVSMVASRARMQAIPALSSGEAE